MKQGQRETKGIMKFGGLTRVTGVMTTDGITMLVSTEKMRSIAGIVRITMAMRTKRMSTPDLTGIAMMMSPKRFMRYFRDDGNERLMVSSGREFR